MYSLSKLMLILAIVVILFGSSKLPELGKGLGSFVKNLKKGMSEPDEIDVTPKEKEKDHAQK